MFRRSGQRTRCFRQRSFLFHLFVLVLLFGFCAVRTVSGQPSDAPIRTVVQSGHNIDVAFVAFAGDESIFASLDDINRIKIWQLPEGRLINFWQAAGKKKSEGSNGNKVFIFDDTGHLVMMENNFLTRWDPISGKEVQRIKLPPVGDEYCVVSPNGAILAMWTFAGTDGKTPPKPGIKVWDIGKGEPVRSFPAAGPCDVLLSPSGSILGCLSLAAEGSSLEIWHTRSGSVVQSSSFDNKQSAAQGLSSRMRALAISDDGSLIALKRNDMGQPGVKTQAIIEIRRSRDMSLLKSMPAADSDHPCRFSADGKRFVYPGMAADKKTEMVRVLDTTDWNAVYEGKLDTRRSTAVSPTARYIAEGAGGLMGSGSYYVTYLVTLHDARHGSRRPIYEEGKWTDHIAISPDGKYLVLNEQRGPSGDEDGNDIVLSRLKLLSLHNGKLIWEKTNEEGDRFKDIGYSHSGRYLISRDTEAVYIWEMPEGKLIKKIEVAYDKFSSGIAISPDGRFFAAVDAKTPLRPAACLFRVSDGVCVTRLERNISGGRKFQTEAMAFSPDGRYVAKSLTRSVRAGGSEDSPLYAEHMVVEIWDIEGKRPVRTIDAGQYGSRDSARSLERQVLATDILAFSSDGNEILAGRKVFRVSDGRQAAVIKTPSDLSGRSPGSFYAGGGHSTSISPGGGIHAYQTHDGGIRIMGLPDGRERVSIYTFMKSAVTLTPEGFFTGSGEFDRDIHFVRSTEVYGFNQFYDVFYRPDLVEMKLRGEDISRYTLGLSIGEALKNPPPAVSIVAPVRDTKVSQRRITVRTRVSDSGGGIGDIRIFNNGKLVNSRGVYRIARIPAAGNGPKEKGPVSSPYSIAMRGVETISAKRSRVSGEMDFVQSPPEHGTREMTCDVDLIHGQNTISLSAFNGTNTVMSSLRTITVEADVPARKPRLFALIIGNNHFKDKKIDLTFAVKDAKDLAELIRRYSSPLFENVFVEVRTDATKAQLAEDLNAIAAKMNPEDVFIFYAASHGAAQDDLYYIFTSDFDGNSIDKQTSVSSIELMEYSKAVPSLRQAYILDTCHAGGVSSIVSGLYDSRLSVLARSLGMHILAGSRTYQQAIDNFEGNGLFTHFLLKGFEGKADLNKDKKVSVMEMNPYLTRSMKTASRGQQEPLLRNFGQDFIITGVR